VPVADDLEKRLESLAQEYLRAVQELVAGEITSGFQRVAGDPGNQAETRDDVVDRFKAVALDRGRSSTRSPWSLRKARRYFEVDYIHEVMKHFPDRRDAARVLGISHSALKEKLARRYLPAR
jgi:DNA-binding NtrC family response regulator